MKAGTLTVARRADMLVMDFPARPAAATEPPPGLLAALGGNPREVLRARDHLVVYDSAAEIATLKPDLAALANVDCWAAIVTAPGENGIDFVSRFFAPAQGVPEDPVTGSSHTTLTPYWASASARPSSKPASSRAAAARSAARLTATGSALPAARCFTWKDTSRFKVTAENRSHTGA